MIDPLSVGIDSLYWSSACGIEPERMTVLKLGRDAAALSGDAQPWRDIDGFALSIAPHGARRYPVLIESYEFRVQVTGSTHLPTLYVQLRSAHIHDVGIAEAYDASVSVAEAIVGHAIDRANASRVDMYADFSGWVIERDDLAGIVTNAKIATHGHAGTAELQTIMVGKTPMAVRVYRKDEEVKERGGFAPLFWGGYDGPVVRVEAQASTAKLRELGMVSVADALLCHGDLWAWATSEFVEFRQPGRGDREDWAVRDEWRAVQQVGLEAFPRCGLVPYRVVQGDRSKIVPQLLGYLSTYAAHENLVEPADVLRRLLRQYPDLSVSSHRRFADEVVRKRALLPKAYRDAQVPSGRDRPPSPEGGDVESSTVGSDA